MDVKDAKEYIKVREGSLLPPLNIFLSLMCPSRVSSFKFPFSSSLI